MRRLALVFLLLAPGPAWAEQLMAPPEVEQGLEAGKIVLIDVRTPAEWAETGIATGARPIDMRQTDFLAQVEALKAANPDKQLAFICRTGHRSTLVVQALEEQGMKDLINVTEGMKGSDKGPGWLARQLPVSKAP